MIRVVTTLSLLLALLTGCAERTDLADARAAAPGDFMSWCVQYRSGAECRCVTAALAQALPPQHAKATEAAVLLLSRHASADPSLHLPELKAATAFYLTPNELRSYAVTLAPRNAGEFAVAAAGLVDLMIDNDPFLAAGGPPNYLPSDGVARVRAALVDRGSGVSGRAADAVKRCG